MISVHMFGVSFVTGLLLAAMVTSAQDIHYVQIDATPLAVNPAFTGTCNGAIRASGLYRNEWASVTVPYITLGVSVDAPVYSMHGSYFAAGISLLKDEAGDGNLTNFSGEVSVAYHKLFRLFTKQKNYNSDLSFGIQAGYDQYSIDLYQLYFGNTVYPVGVSPYHLGLGNEVNYYPVNAGITLAQSLTARFNYIIGVSANNINQPSDMNELQQNDRLGLGPRYNITLGANWQVSDKLTLRPLVFYQVIQDGNILIAGNEFHYNLVKKHTANASVFLGAFYRTGDVITVTAGVEFKAFRIGLGYDYDVTVLNTSGNNGNGGFEAAIKYIPARKRLSRNNRDIPCNRF